MKTGFKTGRDGYMHVHETKVWEIFFRLKERRRLCMLSVVKEKKPNLPAKSPTVMQLPTNTVDDLHDRPK
jgi:hypothetical protein